MENLPHEVLERICALSLSLPEVVHLSTASKTLVRSAAECEESLWEALFIRRWPRDDIFVLEDATLAEAGGAKARYRARLSGHGLTLACECVTFQGWTRDNFNGNVTQASSLVRLQRTADKDNGERHVSGTVHGMVATGKGSITNTPTQGLWKGYWGLRMCGSKVPAPSPGPRRWFIEWKEQLPTNRGHFEYRGQIQDDGTNTLSGTFTWSVMPRKGGTFEFTLRRKSVIPKTVDDIIDALQLPADAVTPLSPVVIP